MKNLWFPYRRGISSPAKWISAELDIGSGYAGNEFNQTSTYSLPHTHVRPPAAPFISGHCSHCGRHFRPGREAHSYVMRRWPTGNTVQWLCRPVTYILRVFGLAVATEAVGVPLNSSTQMLWYRGATPFRSILILPFATTQHPRHRQNNFLFPKTSSPALQAIQPEAAEAWSWSLTSPPPTTQGNEWSHTSLMACTNRGAKRR